MDYYPLRFTPIYHAKVWGGRRLASVMGRALPPEEPIGESWEVADHPHGRSVVANGPLQGKSLHDLIIADPGGVLGTRGMRQGADRFPLLIKYIDATDDLSVQVHPADEYAWAHAGEPGKTEMWFVLAADPGATLIAGLEPGVTAEQFRAALNSGDPAALLHRVPVQAGDAISIPAGRIHAITPGLLILEIQQNSDITYRLYDWGRVGLDGQPRELHVEEALAVTNWQDYAPDVAHPTVEVLDGVRTALLATCPYFAVEWYSLDRGHDYTFDGGSFHVVNVVQGQGTLRWPGGEMRLAFGDSLLAPAALTALHVEPDGTLDLVISSAP
jgi:mannose-6-phosphate isomerase